MHQTSEWNLESSAGYPEPHIEKAIKDLKCQFNPCIWHPAALGQPSPPRKQFSLRCLSKCRLAVPLPPRETWPQNSFRLCNATITPIFSWSVHHGRNGHGPRLKGKILNSWLSENPPAELGHLWSFLPSESQIEWQNLERAGQQLFLDFHNSFEAWWLRYPLGKQVK